MPIEIVPNSAFSYYLIAYDEKGNERSDDPDGKNGCLSARVLDEVANAGLTDLFIISHGWQGDIPAAKNQYGKWIEAMSACSGDIERVRAVRPNFKPLIIGFHWPSLPWGDEELGTGPVSFTPGAGTPDLEGLIDAYAARIADTPAARKALRVIFEAARTDIAPSSLTQDVIDAYVALDNEMGLGTDGEGADPGADRAPFDPRQAYQNAQETEAVAFGSSLVGGILSPLRQLSFWKMKDRARVVGETGGSRLLIDLQQKVPPDKDVRFHLVGHSFGCIVVSSMLLGPAGQSVLLKPVHSVSLLQGALSLWSYCADIPVSKGKKGYFRSVIAAEKVAGPILATQSEHDSAVGTWYPLAAGVKHQVSFAPGELPKYGALGTFGARGPGIEVVDQKMLVLDQLYNFKPGKFYNLNASQFICKGGGFSGAHSDIAKPQVAHAVWSAVATV